MRFVSRFFARIRACVGVRARIGARVGTGGVQWRRYFWAPARALASTYTPLTQTDIRFTSHAHRLQQQVCDLPFTFTAYTNTFTTYRLLLTAYAVPLTLYRSRRRDAFTSHELPPKRLLLSPTQKRLRLSSIWCFLP